MDRNDNQIPDKWEAVFTYLIAGVALILAVGGFYRGEINFVKWALGFAVFLTGQRDIMKYIRK